MAQATQLKFHLWVISYFILRIMIFFDFFFFNLEVGGTEKGDGIMKGGRVVVATRKTEQVGGTRANKS